MLPTSVPIIQTKGSTSKTSTKPQQYNDPINKAANQIQTKTQTNPHRPQPNNNQTQSNNLK